MIPRSVCGAEKRATLLFIFVSLEVERSQCLCHQSAREGLSLDVSMERCDPRKIHFGLRIQEEHKLVWDDKGQIPEITSKLPSRATWSSKQDLFSRNFSSGSLSKTCLAFCTMSAYLSLDRGLLESMASGTFMSYPLEPGPESDFP